MRNILKRLNKNILKSSPYLPKVVYPDDVYLVSYPKSGNTWVRFLLANALNEDQELEIDFHNIQEIIPEVIRNNDFIDKAKRPRLIKSHGLNVSYPRVIYIIRDGRDVYTSYYYYRQNKLPQGTSFTDFLKSEKHYPSLWSDHVNFWLNQSKKSDFLLVRYENLIMNPKEQLCRMLNFVGIELSESNIDRAIQLSSFENMRHVESEKGRPYKKLEDVNQFLRKGEIGNWKQLFKDEDKKIFNKKEGNALIQSGYTADLNW